MLRPQPHVQPHAQPHAAPRHKDSCDDLLAAAATRLAQSSAALPDRPDRPADKAVERKKKAPLPESRFEASAGKASPGKLKMAMAPVEVVECYGADKVSPPRFSDDESAAECGPANALSDADLVAMLRLPPKQVPHLRTRNSFSQYFAGMKAARFTSIIHRAYEDIDEGERGAKVEKRLSLVRDVLS